ncbi:MAG: polymerase PB1 [Bactrocera tryoni orthomyxo-like virus]|nr:MAG: polymerase PB1 [Bactrocera tryoni orthomyxo-like virus]
MFSLVHEIFFKQQNSYDSKDTELNDAKKLMVKISRFTFFLMSIKRIHLGPGLLIGNDQFYNRKDWSDYTKDELNEKTWEWLSKVKISDNNYIEASPGFLMGMLNAASTTVGLLPSNFIEMTDAKIKTLRSSDDSMTVYVGKTPFALIQLLYQNYIYCKMCGINMSTKKTLFFPSGYGEYTSWYQDGEFIGQSGTETSSLRPSGINPQEDFNNIAVQTAVLMRTHIINPLGAIQRLLIGINSVRRLYHIKEKLDGVLSKGVRFLADGGRIPWVLETLLIDETAIRYRNCKTKEDFDYFYRIMNPENPFVQPPEKQFLYSRDLGSIIQTSYNVPQNIFNFVKRSNRTVNNQTSLLESEKEKAFSLAYQIAITIDPSLLLSSGSKKTMLSTYLESNMRMTLMRESCTKEEEAVIERAISKLTQVPSELDSDKGVDSDSDFWMDER